MTAQRSIRKTRNDGHERIEWLDAAGRLHSILSIDPIRALDVQPGMPSRTPGKYVGQRSYQGVYWCAGTQSHVWHESMTEYAALMLLDHLHDIAAVHPQPMVLSFADGTVHYPDHLVVTEEGKYILVDVHLTSRTTENDLRAFENTREMCGRLGWQFEVIDGLDQVLFWNLELLGRCRHPRFAPSAAVRRRILAIASSGTTFGELRAKLRSEKPGEHLPAAFHLMWKRDLRLDLNLPFTDNTVITTA